MSDEGASPRELLLESCRRNNTALLNDLLSSLSTPEKVAHLLNTATDGVGNFCLHVAAGYGSYEVLDTLLDQEGLEVDPVDRLEADIPLHKAVRFVNGLAEGEWEGGAGVVELLLDAGADPRSVMLLTTSHHCYYSSSHYSYPEICALGGWRGRLGNGDWFGKSKAKTGPV